MGATQFLPSWTIGAECYGRVYSEARPYGKKAAVIGGETALSKAFPLLMDAVAGTDLILSKPIVYGKEATYANVSRLMKEKDVKKADMIFAVGGGKAIDTCKTLADKLKKPVFTFPTLGSNCASATTLCVMYHEDGTLEDVYYPDRCPVHVFINTGIIANSPERYLWAGIGDSLAKEFESEYAARADVRHGRVLPAPYLGLGIARQCTGPLIGYGKKALSQIRKGRCGKELEQVLLAIIISAGLVSNLTVDTRSEETYFYNSSLAHAFYYGYAELPGSHKHLHGEVVSFGILVLLTLDGQEERREELFRFYKSMGFPLTMAELEFTRSDLSRIYRKASQVIEWECVPKKISRVRFQEAILETDEAAHRWLHTL